MNHNTFIPAGATSSYKVPIVDALTPVGERFANPNTTQKRIQQRRKDDNIKNQLKKEFDAIDEDGNGFLDRQELTNYFANKGVPQRNLEILVNNVIEVVDENNDGEISM